MQGPTLYTTNNKGLTRGGGGGGGMEEGARDRPEGHARVSQLTRVIITLWCQTTNREKRKDISSSALECI